MLPNLKRHIPTSHRQWKAHDILENNMDLSTVITIEDYQMNMEVKYWKAPTCTAYSCNKQTIAIYTLCFEHLVNGEILSKGGIVFMSDNKHRDYQQVNTLEARAFEMFCEKTSKIEHWTHLSDGCASQFWSHFVAAEMVKMCMKLSLENIPYNRFKAN